MYTTLTPARTTRPTRKACVVGGILVYPESSPEKRLGRKTFSKNLGNLTRDADGSTGLSPSNRYPRCCCIITTTSPTRIYDVNLMTVIDCTLSFLFQFFAFYHMLCTDCVYPFFSLCACDIIILFKINFILIHQSCSNMLVQDKIEYPENER